MLVWPRLTRPIVLALAVPVHLGIALCMGMITFGLVMLIGCLSFVPPWLVRHCIEQREQGRAGEGRGVPGEQPRSRGAPRATVSTARKRA